MVYTEVQIVVGYPVTAPQLKALFHQAEFDWDESRDDWLDILQRFFHEQFLIPYYKGNIPLCGKEPTITVISYPSCSELSEKVYIIGKVFRTYTRQHNIRCGKCEEHSCCDNCLGQTENGVYPVEKFLNTVALVDRDRLCGKCKHESLPVNNDRDLTHQRCTKCFVDQENSMIHLSSYTDQIQRIIMSTKFSFSDHAPVGNGANFYYMVDDCFCCT